MLTPQVLTTADTLADLLALLSDPLRAQKQLDDLRTATETLRQEQEQHAISAKHSDELKELASEAAAQAEEKQTALADLAAKLEAQKKYIDEQTAGAASARDALDAKTRELDDRQAAISEREAQAELVSQALTKLRDELDGRELAIEQREQMIAKKTEEFFNAVRSAG